MTESTAPVRAQRKTKTGRVVSDRMDKTIVVSVERLARHRLYKRVVRLTTKFKAHDEANDAHVGDTVLIEESRPLSATKRWRLVEVVAARRRPRRRDGRARRRGGRGLRGHPRRGASRPGQARRRAVTPPSDASGATAIRRRCDGRTPRASGPRDPGPDPPKVADNTGARTIQCIRVMGRSTKTTAGIGDVIIASVKKAIPNAAVKKGDVVRAVVVRTAKEYGRAGRQLHPLRRERGRAHQQPGQPARDPDLRPGRARAARPQLHEDRVARPGGAVMAAAGQHAPCVPEIRKGDTVRRADRQGRRQAGRGRARHHEPPRSSRDAAQRRQEPAYRRGFWKPAKGGRLGRGRGPQHRQAPHQAAPDAGPDGPRAEDPAGRDPRHRQADRRVEGDARLPELQGADARPATPSSRTAAGSASAATAGRRSR